MGQTPNYMKTGSDWRIGGSQTVEAAGTFDNQGIQKVYGKDVTADRVFRKVINVTIAQVNAGFELLPGVAGKSYTISGYYLRVNGSLGGATDIRISDEAGSPVDVVTVLAAAATSAAEISSTNTISNVTKGAGWLAALTAGKGVQIRKTGSTGTTTTSVDVTVEYTLG